MSLKRLKFLTAIFWSGTGLVGLALLGTAVTAVIEHRREANPPPVSIPLPATP